MNDPFDDENEVEVEITYPMTFTLLVTEADLKDPDLSVVKEQFTDILIEILRQEWAPYGPHLTIRRT